jgi:hypothetical protein
MRRATLLLYSILVVLLVGCLPPIPKPLGPPGPPLAAKIEAVCAGCIDEHVGYAPLSIALFAVEPDMAEYLWDFGDGTVQHGRLGKHTYTAPGRYVVTLKAQKRDGGKLVRYEAQTAFLVLESPSLPANQQTFANELIRVTVIAPKSLAVGQEAQVRYVFTALKRLVYLDVRSVPDEHLFSEHEGYFQRVEIPAGAILEFSYSVRGFASSEGYIQHIIIASDGKTSVEIHERTNIIIRQRKGELDYDAQEDSEA